MNFNGDTVSLHGLKFHAYHGLYPEEQILGNDFEVDIDVHTSFEAVITNSDVENTVDYVILFEIISIQMKRRYELLENLADAICEKIKKRYPTIKQIELKIRKMNPPLGGRCDYSQITIRR